MDLKGALYTIAMFAWFGITVGAWIAIDLGHTAPWLTFADIPGGSIGAMGGVIGVFFAGAYVISSFNERRVRAEWKEAGQQAGLRPAAEPGDTMGPELTGTIDGRTVTARYDKRKVNSAGDSDGYATYTFGEVELPEPTDDGVVLGPAGREVGMRSLEFDDMAEAASTVEGFVTAGKGDIVLVGTSAAVVEAVADALPRDGPRAVGDLTFASVGDASGVAAECAEVRNEEFGFESSDSGYQVDDFAERDPGDAATVTVETRGSIRDGDELRQFAEGVVSIADAFEETTARPPDAS